MLHKYELNGFRIGIDTHSGAIHLFDEISFQLLDFITEPMTKTAPEAAFSLGYEREEIIDAWDELFDLYARGEIFCPPDKRLESLRSVPSPIKSLCLHIAHDCNLRCSYCFADEGCFGGERRWLSFETAKNAIDFLIAQSANRYNLEVDFFGGEPLLNFDVVKKTVEYARSLEKKHNKNFRFTITTNGVLLNDENIEFINKEMSNVVLSLDGRKEVNDRMRKRVDKTGSYDSIVPKFQKLVAARNGKDYYVRGTFTAYNLDFSKDVFHLASLGFDQISVEPVIAPDSAEYALKAEHIPAIMAEYENLTLQILEHRKQGGFFNFFHFMLDINAGPCAIKRIRGCGCGNEYVAIAANGDIYPCHQFVGLDDQKMGNVNQGSFDPDKKIPFAAADVFAKEDCSQCWARFYCSGGCNANNHIYCGSMLKPHAISCELEKKRVECAIMLAVALAETESQEEEAV